MKLFTILLFLFSINIACADSCPTIDFEGEFAVESTSCNHHYNKLTGMRNTLSNEGVVLGFIFNNSPEPNMTMTVNEEMNAASVECINLSDLKSYRWYPNQGDKQRFWGFRMQDGEFYQDQGHCTYKLKRVR